MEAVAKRGGFEFKETLMSEEADGEPHKVLGLIWETEADRLRVEMKLNLGAKKAGLHLMENVMLDDEPEIITKGSCGERHRASTTRWACCAPSPSASRY
jgi:hypothetical protein